MHPIVEDLAHAAITVTDVAAGIAIGMLIAYFMGAWQCPPEQEKPNGEDHIGVAYGECRRIA